MVHSLVGGTTGGAFTVVSMKLSLIPRLHTLLDLRQFWQLGSPSSHLRWRSRQVRQPVRTRLGLFAACAVSLAPEFRR